MYICQRDPLLAHHRGQVNCMESSRMRCNCSIYEILQLLAGGAAVHSSQARAYNDAVNSTHRRTAQWLSTVESARSSADSSSSDVRCSVLASCQQAANSAVTASASSVVLRWPAAICVLASHCSCEIYRGEPFELYRTEHISNGQ
jgi:hypothetical protein